MGKLGRFWEIWEDMREFGSVSGGIVIKEEDDDEEEEELAVNHSDLWNFREF